MTDYANTDPVFPSVGFVHSVVITAANTLSDGSGTIGTDIFLVSTSGRVRLISVIPIATVAATNTAATVIRLFRSNHFLGETTSEDTFLLNEINLPIIAADHSTDAVNSYVLAGSLWTKGYLLVTSHIAPAANTAWRVTLIG